MLKHNFISLIIEHLFFEVGRIKKIAYLGATIALESQEIIQNFK